LIEAASNADEEAQSFAGDARRAVRQAQTDVDAAYNLYYDTVITLTAATLSLLPAIGLVLLNVFAGSAVVEKRGIMAAFIYRCRAIHGWFYRDVGGKLQMLAKVQGVICLVIASLAAITAAIGLCGFLIYYFFSGTGEYYLRLLVIGLSGIAASFIIALPTWLTYAFGQITKDLREVKDEGLTGSGYLDYCYPDTESAEAENPDELPEL
jgi:hypothetical protein